MKKIGSGILIALTIFALSGIVTAIAMPVPARSHGHLVSKITIEEPDKGPPTQPAPRQVTSFEATGMLGVPLGSGANLWAIIIGISDYVGTVNDLRYGDDDAAEVRATLIERYGYPADHIIMLLGDKDRLHYNFPSRLATRENILVAIEEIKGKESAGDEVVFYYSGHGGYSDVNMDGDLEVVDEGIYVQDGKFIWDGELATWFAGFETSRIVFGFDSCLAGGMSPDLDGSGRIVAMASTEEEYAYELGGRIRNGEFTYWFVDDGMYDGRADTTPEDGYVTVEEAWDWANVKCVYDTPTIADSFDNDLLLGYYGPKTLLSIAVTPESATIPVGGTQQFAATGIYSDGSEAELTAAVSWTGSDEGVAIIDDTGLATGVHVGTVTIAAALESLSDTATLKVTEAPAVSVTIEKVVARDIRLGGKYNIQAKIKNTGAEVAFIHVDTTVSGKGGTQVLVTQEVTIDPGAQANVLFKDKCALPKGIYIVTVTVQEDTTATGSDTFQVK